MHIISGVIIVLAGVGAINWGLIGAFNFNLVEYIFGTNTTASKVIYILVGIAGVGLILSLPHALNLTDWPFSNSGLN